jgi:heterogeneous nuclear ribonucleoprotein U-like protein 1
MITCSLSFKNIFQVIFTELSRDEAQRTLDEMQHMLPRIVTPSYGNSSNQNHVMVPLLLLFLK